MSTARTLIDAARRELLAGLREERNKLAAGVTATDTTFTFTFDLRGVQVGSVVEVGTELVYVWSVNLQAKSTVVERGWDGTTAAAHDADAVVSVNPRFPMHTLFAHLNDELASLASPNNGLYAVKTLDLEYNGTDREVSLEGATRLLDVIEVRRRVSATDWPVVREWRLQRHQSPEDFTASNTLRLDSGFTATDLRVIYKAAFLSCASLDNDVSLVTGLPDSAEDVLRMGVQMRALAGRESKRAFMESQGDTRRPEEVREGAMANSWRGIAALRQQRIVEEAAKLAARYAVVMRR